MRFDSDTYISTTERQMKHNFIGCLGLLTVSYVTFKTFDYSISILWKISNSFHHSQFDLHAKTCTQILLVRI